MGKIRNVSGNDLEMAPRDGVATVPDADVYAYTVSANWEPVDKPATMAHNAGEKAEKAAVEAEQKARGIVAPEPEPEPAEADA